MCTILLASLCFVLAGAQTRAQSEQTPPGANDQAMQEMMAKMMPGEQHKALHHMVGKWKTHQRMWMTPGAPPMESEGACEYESMFGGRFVQGRFQGTMTGQPFEGFSIDGYDNFKQRYFSFWIDSMGTGYYVAHGTRSADGKTFTHEGMMFDPMVGADTPTRATTVLVDDKTVVFTMYQTISGQEHKGLEITYTRM
jgi:hypothetical protein